MKWIPILKQKLSVTLLLIYIIIFATLAAVIIPIYHANFSGINIVIQQSNIAK